MKNKVTTYLLYAIGEIILVVIGILIAVSINNWNTNRANEKLAANYLKAMMNDTQENIAYMEESITYHKEQVESLEAQKKIMNGISAFPELSNYIRNHFYFGYKPEIVISNTTFNTLESTGHMQILAPEVRDSIYAYQAALEKSIDLIKYNIEWYASIDQAFFKEYPLTGGENDFLESRMDDIWNSLDSTKFITRFNALASNKLFNENLMIRYKLKIKNISESFMPFLEQEQQISEKQVKQIK